MNEINKNELSILRQRVPVGIRDGLVLLEKVNGNIDQAVQQFQDKMMKIIIDETGVTHDIAAKHLIKNNYNIALSLESINEELHTLTERILLKYKNNKEDGLNNIMYAIENKYQLNRKFWLDFATMKELPAEIFCFMTIMEWMNYESWEGFEIALTFDKLNIVIEQLENTLMFPDLADTLRKASEMIILLYDKYEAGNDIKNYFKAVQKLKLSKKYQEYENMYIVQKESVIDKLYYQIKTNINLFP